MNKKEVGEKREDKKSTHVYANGRTCGANLGFEMSPDEVKNAYLDSSKAPGVTLESETKNEERIIL